MNTTALTAKNLTAGMTITYGGRSDDTSYTLSSVEKVGRQYRLTFTDGTDWDGRGNFVSASRRFPVLCENE